ncbi:MAG: SRPBCC domain-containing protein [Pseudomonadota bacterium]
MKTYQIAIDIAAMPQTVWQVLTKDMPAGPQAFGIRKLEGELKPGGHLKLWSEIDPKRAFALQVTTMEAQQRMVWRGGMPFGLFTGTRTFQLSPISGRTRFEMMEVFTGPLSGLIVKSTPDLTPSFTTFANTLKAKAENP